MDAEQFSVLVGKLDAMFFVLGCIIFIITTHALSWHWRKRR